MRKFIIVLGIMLFIYGAFRFIRQQTSSTPVITETSNILPSENRNPAVNQEVPAVTVLAENLDTPWALAFLPDSSLLVTERKGTVRLINADGQLQTNPVATIASSQENGEGGLLGIAIHPDFANNKFVYLYYTYGNEGNNTLNRVVRLTYNNAALANETIIVDAIPGAANHNGGRIKFGPDNFLYIATGDAQDPSQSQDLNSLAGKILRVTDNGQPAPDNPFNNPVYSYGHRNVQGLAWDNENNLWATEHGRSGFPSGLDELNLIQPGKNYGWPVIQGDDTRSGMETPKSHSGGSTWAPSGASFVNNALFFSGLRGQGLYQASINDNEVNKIDKHFDGVYGRIREVVTGPDGLLYITTSNQDGRGMPATSDDRVIRVNPHQLP